MTRGSGVNHVVWVSIPLESTGIGVVFVCVCDYMLATNQIALGLVGWSSAECRGLDFHILVGNWLLGYRTGLEDFGILVLAKPDKVRTVRFQAWVRMME
ncbi:hypothetical protein AG1IA_02101 [Rhizoctonia solani AG-1 IA]|uniref:Uncharacterized protein n=1 Tax=Thanatephorus cucumeris (strain AG1-IA) TaxID=983506 RepID=L8X0Y4_THACA|nr:hypothetical protein AG1IA_02101 [Rhizoctonia solani AG-1 IA]